MTSFVSTLIAAFFSFAGFTSQPPLLAAPNTSTCPQIECTNSQVYQPYEKTPCDIQCVFVPKPPFVSDVSTSTFPAIGSFFVSGRVTQSAYEAQDTNWYVKYVNIRDAQQNQPAIIEITSSSTILDITARTVPPSTLQKGDIVDIEGSTISSGIEVADQIQIMPTTFSSYVPANDARCIAWFNWCNYCGRVSGSKYPLCEANGCVGLPNPGYCIKRSQ